MVVLNVTLVVLVLLTCHVLSHLTAVRAARRQGLPRPAFLDFAANRRLQSSNADWRDPKFVTIFVIALIVVVVAAHLPLGLWLAVAAADALAARALYRYIRS